MLSASTVVELVTACFYRRVKIFSFWQNFPLVYLISLNRVLRKPRWTKPRRARLYCNDIPVGSDIPSKNTSLFRDVSATVAVNTGTGYFFLTLS
jgi:hypothetical protein